MNNICLCLILFSDSTSDAVLSSAPAEMKPRLESVDDIEVQNYIPKYFYKNQNGTVVKQLMCLYYSKSLVCMYSVALMVSIAVDYHIFLLSGCLIYGLKVAFF